MSKINITARALYLFSLLFALFCTVAYAAELTSSIDSEPTHYAWWLRIHFKPAHKTIRGIPIGSLVPSWVKASELKKEAIPESALFKWGKDIMEENGLVFSRSGDFNKDGREDTALIGVYEKNNGEMGNFLLILTKSADGTWEKAFLDSWTGFSNFAALSKEGENVEVWFCMECDNSSELIWNKELKKYIWAEKKEKD